MRKLAPLALLLGTACHGKPAPPARHLDQDTGTEASLLRLPADGGAAVLLRPDRLTHRGWEIPDGLPAISAALGADLEDGVVYAVDDHRKLVAVDLRTHRVRTYPNQVRELAGTIDGGDILGLDSLRRPLLVTNRNIHAYRDTVDKGSVTLLRGPGTSVVAVQHGEAYVIGEQGEIRHFRLPPGAVSSTWSGDMVAVTSDSGVALIDRMGSASAKPRTQFVKLKGKPLAATFSPSGHRLYVARERGDLAIVDRFDGQDVMEIKLPAAANALRVDHSGRWLLARAVRGDSVWVIDLAQKKVLASVHAPWAADLPLIPDGKTLVVRQGADVVSYDLSGPTPVQRGRIEHGAADIYLGLAWAARAELPTVTPQVVTTTAPTVDSTAPPVTASSADTATDNPAPAKAAAVYLQVSSSQNKDWAGALAKQLHDGGFAAKVLDPKTPDEGYRVVVGPFQTRDEAEVVAKRLGRPSFIITPGAIDP
ncbi:MAG TPA: SPOR domain-containing protein [Gemmatimonadales bacterium]|nr:SPOR domain-containing protein [Gemmatimonadales bacterium]